MACSDPAPLSAVSFPRVTDAGLYLHIPFCVQKCGYCDFYSLPADADTIGRYTQRLCLMIRGIPGGPHHFRTVYFGGGTPSLLGARNLCAILETAARFHTLGDEITLEANPGAGVSKGFFTSVRQSGFNRLSLGMQSASERLLRLLGRVHTGQDAARAVRDAAQAGFQSISLDVMLALPGQTRAELDATLRFAIDTGVTHLSAYLLKIEPGTPFAKLDLTLADDDAQAEEYLYTVEQLARAGLQQYEISNFSIPGYESQHNLGYWLLRPYWGLGPSAHSFIGGKRYSFDRSLSRFLDAPDPYTLLQCDGTGGDLQEAILLGLRMVSGISVAQLEGRYKTSLKPLLSRAQPLVSCGLMQREGDRLSLTPRGFLVSNPILVSLLDTLRI